MIKDTLEPFIDSLTTTAWNLLAGAFTGQAAYIDNAQWGVAVAFTNKLTVVMVGFTVLAGLIQVGRKLFQGRMREAITPAILVVVAWPLTGITVWITIMSVAAVDKIVVAMLGTQSNDSLSKLFEAATLLGTAQGLGNPAGGGALTANLLMLLILWVFSLVLSMVMIFRNFALIVLVAFAPLALMLIPAETTRAWSKRWAETVVALLLTKPIAAGLLIISAELVGSVSGLASALMALVGIIVACASPMAAMSLVKFTGANLGAEAGGDASAATTRGARATGRGAMRAGRSLVSKGR